VEETIQYLDLTGSNFFSVGKYYWRHNSATLPHSHWLKQTISPIVIRSAKTNVANVSWP